MRSTNCECLYTGLLLFTTCNNMVIRMKVKELTEKELLVLTYFIENESAAMSDLDWELNKPIILECKDEKKHFLAYPAKIVNDLKAKKSYKTISKKWAIEVCNALCKASILDYEELKAPRQKNPTEHYFLKSNLEAFRKVTRYVNENAQEWEKRFLFSKAYFQQNINDSLIEEVMSEKKVEMCRSLDFWNWEPFEAELLFGKCSRIKEITFEEYIKKMIMEKYCSKESSSPFSNIHLRLPVFKEGPVAKNKLRTEKLEILKKLNKTTFKDYPSLKFQQSGIIEHYMKLQKQKWIIPLLALIKSSPMALAEFLYGKWDCPDYDAATCICYSKEGVDNFRYSFFRLLFVAISDIALTRDVETTDVQYAEFRSSSSHRSEKTNHLLRIAMKSGFNVYFDGGFDTNHYGIGTESGDVIEMPDEKFYWAKAWINYPTFFSTTFLKLKDIVNFELFVKKLINKNDPMGRFLFNRLANYMKNILLHFSILNKVPDSLKEDFLFEINEIIFSTDFSRESVYCENKLSDYTRNEIKQLWQSETSTFFDPNLIHFIKNSVNRLILEDVCEGIIVKNSMRLNKEKEGEEDGC